MVTAKDEKLEDTDMGACLKNLTLQNCVCQSSQGTETALKETVREPLTAMDALDLVKERYAANFVRMDQDTGGSYYYKLPFAEYYLDYEGQGETEEDYLIHLYEYVANDTEEGIGHYVTYGWYTVNRTTGEITEQS